MPLFDAAWGVDAAAMDLLPDGAFEAHDGAWVGPDGTLRFVRARRDARGVWTLDGVEGRWGTLVAAASSVRVADTLEARDVRWTPCTCDDGSPTWWSVRAEGVSRPADGPWALHRPRFEATLPGARSPLVLPLPDVIVSADEGWRPDTPHFGRDTQGWRASLGVRREDGAAIRSAGAWWREARAAGLSLALSRTDGGWLRAEGGIPLRNASPGVRGIAQGAVAAAGADWATAAELDAASDAAWAADMGEGWSARSVPWRESRALARVGPARLTVSSIGGWDARVRPSSTWTGSTGAARVEAFAGLGAAVDGAPRVRSGGRLAVDLAPAWLDVHADAAVAGSPGERGAHVAVLDAALPGWVARRGAPVRWAIGGRVAHGGDDPSSPSSWRAGPVASVRGGGTTWQATARGAVLRDAGTGRVHSDGRVSVQRPGARLTARWDEAGADGAAELGDGPWGWRLSGGRGARSVPWVDEVLRDAWSARSGGGAPGGGAWLVAAVSGDVGRVRAGVGLRVAEDGTAPEADVSWSDGCTRLGVRGWWDPAAGAPGVAVQVVPWTGASFSAPRGP